MSLSTFDVFKSLDVNEDMLELTTSQVKQLQQTLYGMIEDIDDACAKHGIEYFLCGGSTLGAIRHQGFIPWDDDIDLYMTRSEYQRFCTCFDAELGTDYLLFDPERSTRFVLGFAQVRKKGTYTRQRDDFYFLNDECGACIDIFVLDNVPNNPVLRAIHGAGSLALGLVASCRKFAEHRDWFLKLAGDNADAAKTFKRKAAIGRLFMWRSENDWIRTWDRWNGLCKNDKSKCLSDPAGRTHYFASIQPREVFQPAKRVSFESRELPVPNDADAYLTAHFGPDYMTPPPADHEERHVLFGFEL